jgi:Subtilase family
MLRPAPRPRRWRTLAGVLAALLAAPAVAVGSASAAQADAVRQQELWVLNAINVAGAWQHTHGSGVTVALIDSGVNGQVSDLTGSVTTGRDFSGVTTPPTDPNWGVHGTWMASLIAGHGHAGGSSGIMGVAPAAKILSIRAVTDQGDPGYHRYQHESESRVQGHLADAINYATSRRVSVISMSLGYQGPSLAVRVAISKALAHGIVVVASSGNSGGASSGSHGNAPYSFPADYPGVIGVGAVGQDGLPAGFSSDNLSVQVAAPGVRVPAQGRDGQYWLVSGTSPACALTAGVAALIKSVYPAMAPALVAQAITASTSDKPRGGYDEEVGSGTVDATAALRMAGRLARDQGTGHGLVAAAQFGGGPAAIPAVPVAPRTKRQFLLDSGIALICLAVVLVVAFRLIVTRKPATAGVPGDRPGPGPVDPRVPGGWAGSGPADPRAPAGWAGSGPVDARAAGGWVGDAQQAAGPPDATLGPAASGAEGARPDGAAPGYGRPGRYWAPGGYKPPAGHPSSSGYGPSDGAQPDANAGLPADPGPAASDGLSHDLEPPAGYGPPTGNGLAAGYGRSASPALPGAPGAPGARGATGAYEAMASGSPDAHTGPVAGFGEPVEPSDPGAQAADPPSADDDTWPSSGQW